MIYYIKLSLFVKPLLDKRYIIHRYHIVILYKYTLAASYGTVFAYYIGITKRRVLCAI